MPRYLLHQSCCNWVTLLSNHFSNHVCWRRSKPIISSHQFPLIILHLFAGLDQALVGFFLYKLDTVDAIVTEAHGIAEEISSKLEVGITLQLSFIMASWMVWGKAQLKHFV